MDESTFHSKMCYAQVMRDVGDQPEYWAGYVRGLRRAYHGENFGTEEEHALWSTPAEHDDISRLERKRGYHDGFNAA